MTDHRIPDHEIARLNLGADLGDVARRLGVKLVRKGGRLIGPCPVCGSGTFTVRKDRAGHWRWDCWASGGGMAGAGGRALDLIAAGPRRQHTLGWPFLEAIRFLGGDAARTAERDPEAAAKWERQRQEDDARAEKERLESLATARDMWRSCVALDHPEAVPVRAYLRDTRRLDLEAAFGGWPVSIRFGEVLPYKAQPWGGHEARPAMVAAVVRGAGADRELVGVHRTFLTRDPDSGSWVKDVDRFGKEGVKQSLGPIGGGAVRLTKSPREGGRHLLTEGLETGWRVALSVLAAGGGEMGRDWYVWAALSTSGFYGLDWTGFLPADRVVMGDNDAVKKNGARPGQDAAAALVARSRTAGIPSVERIPPVENADWDDIGRGEVAA